MSMSGRFCAELEERALSDGRFLVSSGMSSTHSSQTISELSMVAVEGWANWKRVRAQGWNSNRISGCRW